jgi:prepilin-type N-terminal cleavage/methylation domain-containing protein
MKRFFFKRNGQQHSHSGMTLIELLMAMSVAAIGLTAITGLFVTAIASNSRAKRDTTATLLSQSVMEQILLAGTNNAANIPMTDCLGNAFNLSTLGAAGAGAGAAVNASGDISFAAGAPGNGYSMNFNVCRANGQTMLFDVRWNVLDMDVSGVNVLTRLVRVSAAPVGTNDAKFFVAPITLRGIASVAQD